MWFAGRRKRKVLERYRNEEQFYAEKPFTMVSHAEGLMMPVGPLFSADRDFLTFELLFFYYFVYDYKVFSRLDEDLRGRILGTFLERVQASRPDNFHDVTTIEKFYQPRILAYFTITQEISMMGEFGEKCADYMNTLLTYSEENNTFTCHSREQAKRELQPNIEPSKYKDELTVLLTVSSSSLMIHGVDLPEMDDGI